MNRRKKLLVGLTMGGVVFAGSFAMAANLGVTSNTLGAGSADVISCDSDGVTTGYSPSFNNTTAKFEFSAVSVTGVATACAGKTMTVYVTNQSGSTTLANGSLTVGSSGTESVTLSGAVDANLADYIHVMING